MSNPLLNPKDGRFRKPQIGGGGAQNPFSDPDAATKPPTSQESSLYGGSTSDPQPYTPHYVAQQRARYPLLLVLGGLGWGAAVVGAVSMTGIFAVGWMAPLLGVGPTAAGWLLANEDLKAIRVGAIPSAARGPTRHAWWLGLTGLLACIGVVGGMIAQQMHALPDL